MNHDENTVERAIDWLAVDMVCQEGVSLALSAAEKRAVIRRLAPRMLTRREMEENYWSPSTASKLTAGQIAQRLQATQRSVWRLLAELPPAEQRNCPVCREPMWVRLSDNAVEPHADRIFEQCPMSGRPPLRGLAALRPDLYPWLPAVAS